MPKGVSLYMVTRPLFFPNTSRSQLRRRSIKCFCISVKQGTTYYSPEETGQCSSRFVLLIVDNHLLRSLLYDTRIGTATIFAAYTTSNRGTTVRTIGDGHLSSCLLRGLSRTSTLWTIRFTAIVGAATFLTSYLHNQILLLTVFAASINSTCKRNIPTAIT